MSSARLAALSRRRLLLDLGRGSLGIAVFGLAACAPGSTGSPSAGSSEPTGDPTGPGTSAGGEPSPSTDAGGTRAPAGEGFFWQRVDLGFVSAYVLVTGNQAVVVDTGTEGSAASIEAVLGEVGLGWGDVGHVVLTHHHGDHAGSIGAVLEAATGATGYIGAADLPNVTAPRALTPLEDGADVAGLRIVATPGHTPGHIAVLDPVAGILVAGDALGVQGGAAVAPNAQFTADMATAEASVKALAELAFETLLVGHGEPLETGGQASVAALAASL